LALNVVLTDDIDYAATADETVEFELDGIRYEIDLSRRNAMRLRGDLQRWVAAARRTGGRRLRRSTSEPPGQSALATERRAAIRQWARNNGHGVAVFGRIPRKVLEAYTAAATRQ
jgi:hypothetical protein